MKSPVLAFAALALACILAAGGGAYLAVRHGGSAPPVTDQHSTAATPVAHGTPAALVTTPPAAADSAPVAAPATPAPQTAAAAPAPSREAEKPARRNRAGTRGRESARESDQATAATGQADGSDRPAGPPPPEPSAAQQTPPAAAQPQPPTQLPEPQREFVELTVPPESVLGLQIQTSVSSETARVEDRVDARVIRDVRIDDRVAIPAGTQAIGTVVQVDRGGKLKDRAHFAIRFTSLILPDGTRLPFTAEAVHREGPSPANKSAARIGGATIGGAILGAILGGGKGAAIGGAIGAGGGTAATMASDREPATLAAGSIVNIRLMSPVTVTLER